MLHRFYDIPMNAGGALCIMPHPPAERLASSLAALKQSEVEIVLSMLTREEAAVLGLRGEEAACKALGLDFWSHPIPDFGLPDLAAFSNLIDRLSRSIEAGSRIAVHCRAGIGRSGMVAAGVLVARGESPGKARERVSAARGVSVPDTVEQGDFVATFAQMPKDGSLPKD